MKEVMAIIRMNKINPTKAALVETGFPAFTAHKVMGRGKRPLDQDMLKAIDNGSLDASEVLPLMAHGPRLMPKRLLSLMVPEERVPDVVKTIMDVNRSGNPGDGKVFVLPLSDVIRVRTEERGRAAIDEMTGE